MHSRPLLSQFCSAYRALAMGRSLKCMAAITKEGEAIGMEAVAIMRAGMGAAAGIMVGMKAGAVVGPSLILRFARFA